MVNRKISWLGPASVLALCIATFVIWARMYPLSDRFGDYETITHSLGQISGLLGTVLFGMSFVLTTKLKFFEDIYGGMDKVYRMHHILGTLSFVLILFHPLLLVVKFIPSNFELAARYLWPSGSWAVNYGIIALLGMILLLVLTFFVKLKYGTWKMSHKFLGVVFIIACLHIFLVQTDISNSILLRNWMIGVCGVGILSHVYGSYIRPIIHKRYKYKVSFVSYANYVTVIELTPINEKINFKPGQFVFLDFIYPLLKEKHPFTIASANGDKLRFMIKSLGDFTYDISKVPVGTIVNVDGPYGRMTALEDKSEQVWIAGGIGITPFLSYIESMAATKSEKKVDLYYTVKKKEEAVAYDRIAVLSKGIKNLRVFLHVSDEKGYLNAELIEKSSQGLSNKNIYLCGPPAMMHSLRNQFEKIDISKKKIFMEEFAFS